MSFPDANGAACFFSAPLFLAILLQSSQGCAPSNVFERPTCSPSFAEYSITIPTQAAVWRIAQWPPSSWQTAAKQRIWLTQFFTGRQVLARKNHAKNQSDESLRGWKNLSSGILK
jgi:hypothetical protein